MSAQQRIGIYGGTFDPPHLGHLILAETAADSFHLHAVLFVPAAEPPLKDKQNIRAPAWHRLAMVELAIAGNPRFSLSRIDMDRPGPHYSVDMVRLLRQDMPDAWLFFVMGADSLINLPLWHRAAELIHLAPLVVARRPGIEPDIVELDRRVPGLRQQMVWFETPLIDISASALARRIASRKSVRYQVPDAVHDYIMEHGLYRNLPSWNNA